MSTPTTDPATRRNPAANKESANFSNEVPEVVGYFSEATYSLRTISGSPPPTKNKSATDPVASNKPCTFVVYVNSGFNTSRATAAVINFVDEAGINAFAEFREPRRVPIHSTATQLCEGKSETIFVNARDILPVRVMTDSVVGALRAESSATRGTVPMARSF